MAGCASQPPAETAAVQPADVGPWTGGIYIMDLPAAGIQVGPSRIQE